MQMTRRDFLRSAAMSAALAAVAGPAGVARAAEANTPEKWVKGVCRYCGTGCGVLVGVKNGKAVAIKGDPNNQSGLPLSQGRAPHPGAQFARPRDQAHDPPHQGRPA